jgi:hypothetical protein
MTAPASFSCGHLKETDEIAALVGVDAVKRLAVTLSAVRARGGRLFFLRRDGGATHAADVVCDFRKLFGRLARSIGATILGIVGRDGGFAANVADAVVAVPTVNPESVTPSIEAFQALLLYLIWASPRELLNAFQADAVGCHIITLTPDILRKWPLIGRDLREISLDTVRMFRSDVMHAGLSL